MPLWPALGNHDALSVSALNQTGPFFEVFSLPTSGEVGGVPSSTEAYYSFDYANIHFVCLDSERSNRDPNGPMLTWLAADLSANQADWTIVFFHHPPYSKGSHDSDSEARLVDMRQNALPILEAAGVDLVLTGHSHAYERSALLDGHYGDSASFNSNLFLDSGNGQPEGDGAYVKTTIEPTANSGTVYVTMGSSASLSNSGNLDHPALPFSYRSLGSIILEVFGHRLDLRFIDEQGAEVDHFSVLKPLNHAPECSDSIDNDGDGAIDFPADSACADAFGAGESPFANLEIRNDSQCVENGVRKDTPCRDDAGARYERSRLCSRNRESGNQRVWGTDLNGPSRFDRDRRP